VFILLYNVTVFSYLCVTLRILAKSCQNLIEDQCIYLYTEKKCYIESFVAMLIKLLYYKLLSCNIIITNSSK